MCIFCNAGDIGHKAYGLHLRARVTMKQASDAFLEASKSCENSEQAKRYKSIAYKMKRMIKDWNRLEEERELPTEPKVIETVCLPCGKKYGKKNKPAMGIWMGNCDLCGKEYVSVADAAHDFGIFSSKDIEDLDKVQDLI